MVIFSGATQTFLLLNNNPYKEVNNNVIKSKKNIKNFDEEKKNIKNVDEENKENIVYTIIKPTPIKKKNLI